MNEDIESATEFALEGHVALEVRLLIAHSPIAQWISAFERPSIFGHQEVTEFRVTGLPTESWSRGERLLWRFILSVAGRATINLRELIDYYQLSPLRTQILTVLEEALLVPSEQRHERSWK